MGSILEANFDFTYFQCDIHRILLKNIFGNMYYSSVFQVIQELKNTAKMP